MLTKHKTKKNKKFIQNLIIILVATFGFLFCPGLTFASKNGLVIDEFRIGTVDSAYNEYVVIANFGTDKVKLDGYSLARKSKTATTYNTLFGKFINFCLEPNKKIVIGHEQYSGVKDFPYSSSSYSITSDNTIALLAPDKTVVDLVGFGDAITFDGQPIPEVNPNEVFHRTNGIDTDNNLTDFVLAKNEVEVDKNAYNLVISELYPNPNSGESEWFEIYNPTNLVVSPLGLRVCDLEGSSHCYSFIQGDVFQPFSYKSFSQDKTRITLNNDGDALILYDAEGNVANSSGDSYGDAAKGESFSKFGSEWRWTKVSTRETENIYVSTVETEVDKPVSSTTKKTKSKNIILTGVDSPAVNAIDESQNSTVKGAASDAKETTQKSTSVQIGSVQIGWTMIVLAIIIISGYILYENKERLREIFNKNSRRDN